MAASEAGLPESLMRLPFPSEGDFAPYYRPYLEAIQKTGVAEPLLNQALRLRAMLGNLTDEGALHRYAEGKWSVKEVLGHIMDTERVMSYRVLRISRGDISPLPGFDQDAYIARGSFDARPLSDLLDELTAVREATLTLLQGLPAGALANRGTASGFEVTAGAVVWIIAGHFEHHAQLLADRYGVG